ncbi:MAG: pilus assembly protein PilM [Candidatus Omnitrophota bacterium]
MANKKQVCIFFGPNSLCFVETQKKAITNFFDVPHNLLDNTQNTALPNDIKLTAIIQKSLRDRKIDTSEVYISLANQDIILRSFFIPWMAASEVKGVIDFEARRYIPFKLEDIAYTYHSAPIIEKKSKRLRILFVGIKKDVLDRYCSVLEQAGLKTLLIEPASLSLLRLLSLKKQVNPNQKTAIVQMNKAEGTIIIVDHGIPQFVRDFRLSSGSHELTQLDPTLLGERITSEIRISIEYDRRQNAGNVEKILLVSSFESKDFVQRLSEELSIANISTINARQLLGVEEEVSSGVLNALGGSLKDAIPFNLNINLIKSRAKPVEPEKIFEAPKLNYNLTIKIAAACACLVMALFGFQHLKIADYQKKLSDQMTRQGVYESLSIVDIETKQKDLDKKIKGYANIRLKSNVSFFLQRIPHLLPEGAWLSRLTIDFTNASDPRTFSGRAQKPGDEPLMNSRTSLDMDGFVFAQDPNQQINLVNKLIASLKNDKQFSQPFEAISLVNAQKQDLKEHTVTSFKIICR